MKIQINSLEAIERLIGGDTELELEIRSSIVQEFTRKHLKAVANEAIVGKAANVVADQLTKALFEEYTERGSVKLRWRYDIIKQIDDKIEKAISSEITDRIDKVISQTASIEKINQLLDRKAAFITDQLTDRALEQKLDALVNKKVKEKLGL